MVETPFINLHLTFIWRKYGVLWIFLSFMLSGSLSTIRLDQTTVVVSSLGHNVALKCELIYSAEDEPTNIPILYWEFLNSGLKPAPRLWPKNKLYEARVELLETNPKAPNKSILLKDVRWEDSGVYLCKLSITTNRTGSKRINGMGTRLRVYDTMFFNTTAENDTQLLCTVKVSRDRGFFLSVTHNGLKQTFKSTAEHVPNLPYVSLFGSVPLRNNGIFECQLHLNDTLIDGRTYHYIEPKETEYPQPWLLYVSSLLAPLLLLLTAMVGWLC